jgi:hypothetical protein
MIQKVNTREQRQGLGYVEDDRVVFTGKHVFNTPKPMTEGQLKARIVRDVGGMIDSYMDECVAFCPDNSDKPEIITINLDGKSYFKFSVSGDSLAATLVDSFKAGLILIEKVAY